MKTDSTRRTFLWKAGLLASAPLAGTAFADPGGHELDPQAVDDLNALRELHGNLVLHINDGTGADSFAGMVEGAWKAVDEDVRRISADRYGPADRIRLHEDGHTAAVEIRCTIHTETEIGPNCTLVEMARLQGGGVVRRSVDHVLATDCVKRDGVWKILRAELRSSANA